MLKLSGAWLCGLSSVPQGSGLSRLRSSSSIPSRGPPLPPPTSRVASSTSLTRATKRSASHATSRPQMIGLTSWKREIPRTRRRMMKCQQTLWVVVTCVLLGKLASKHTTSDHGGRLPSHRLSSLHAESVDSSRPPFGTSWRNDL